ncbi:MAG: DMT family transporter [Beijerinckiaceae bacterium]
MTQLSHRFTPFDVLLYALLLFAWGTSWIAIRAQVGEIAPEVSVFWRFLLAAAAMLAIARLRGDRLAYGRADHLRFAALGLFLFSSNFILFYHASLSVPSGLLAVAFSLASIVNMALAFILFRKPVEGRALLGALLGACGVALLFAPEILRTGFDRGSALGFLFCALGTLSFCIGKLVSGDSPKRGVAVIPASAWGMVYGTFFCGLFALAFGRRFGVEWTVAYIGALLFLALSASVLAFYAYLTLLGRIGPARAGYATVMFPLVALAISTIFENYQWTAPAMIGAMLALLGNWLVLSRK